MKPFRFWLCLALCVCCSLGAWAQAPTKGSPQFWDLKRLGQPPQTFPAEVSPSNTYWLYGKEVPVHAGVKPIFLEGEKYKGKETRVFAWYGVPEGASEAKPVPGIVLIHGGGGTAEDYWVKAWMARGYAAITVDMCSRCPLKAPVDGRTAPPHAYSGPLDAYRPSTENVNEPIQDQWVYHAVAGVIRAHSFLRSLKGVDANRIGVTGPSWGGYFTSVVMGVDPRFKCAAPVYGCGFYDELNAFRLMNAKPVLQKRWIDLWDARNYIPSTKCPVLWCTGTNDYFYYLDALRKSYELLPNDVPLYLSIKYKMSHAGFPTCDTKEIRTLIDATLKSGQPLPEIKSTTWTKESVSLVFDLKGRTLEHAELLWTNDAGNRWSQQKRNWTRKNVPVSSPTSLTCPVPPDAVCAFVNLHTSDGLILSSRIFVKQNP